MVTSEQVAKLAGVSRATVSRVLNGSGHISEQARERVHAAITALGYQPDIVAQNLVRQRSRMIAFNFFTGDHTISFAELSRTENYFYLDMLMHIQSETVAAGYDLVIPSRPSGEYPANFIQSLNTRRIAGVILLANEPTDPSIRALYDAKIPTIFVDVDIMVQDKHATYVRSDNQDGARQVTEYLIGLGHRRIAFLTGPMAELVSTERLLGSRQALASAGLVPDPGLVRQSKWGTNDAYLATKELLAERQDFTAIVGGSDMMAIGILRALHEAGIRVPQDISLTGFDDVVLSQFTAPPLTTVRQNRQAMAKGAIQRLIAMIENEEPVSPLIVSTELVVRESTGPAPS
jgi:LacI family transcriptional regulator